MSNDHSAFVGEIPTNYDRYLGPIIFDEYADDLARRIDIEGDGRLLETAAGTGLATRKIRSIVNADVRIVATDLNVDMLKLAEAKFGSTENIEFRPANALELPFGDASFDAVACQFSVMFFPDKLAALNEAARVLKPGGTFHFNIWDSLEHNEFIRVAYDEIRAAFPDDPPDFFDTPYGYYDINGIKTLLGQAGFADIDISVLPRPCNAGSPRDVALGYVLGTPVRLQIMERDANALETIVDRVEQAIGSEFGTGPSSVKMQAIVFSAQLSV